ncbi:MAG: hypothetical protein IJM98_03610 [Oscillospiraceae bacterium]|nr:hypothetical protein [Oscillospiraceae bacterium]
MTVKECYEHAISFLPEKMEENPDMQKFMVSWCNILLAENFENENFYRTVNEMPEISAPGKVEQPEDEIPYNEKLVKTAFPYGMARWIFRENDDVYASHEYYTLYVTAAKEATPALVSDIEDIYK